MRLTPQLYSLARYAIAPAQRDAAFARYDRVAAEQASQYGLPLDDTLNADAPADMPEALLTAFLADISARRVAPGAVLLADRCDGLERDRIVPAAELLHRIAAHGITVVTMPDGQRHDAESGAEPAELIVSLTLLAGAQERSATRARRLGAAWESKRQRAAAHGDILTARTPAWLRAERTTGGFTVIEAHAATIRNIFALAEAGRGKTAIAAQLDAAGIPSFGGRGWQPSYIQKLLDNAAVIGRFQPMRRHTEPHSGKRVRLPAGPPIDGYFPAIITAEQFARVRELRRQRRTAPGRPARSAANLLAGLAICGACGSPLRYVNKGRPPKGRVQLVCAGAQRHDDTCNAPPVAYAVTQTAILDALDSAEINLATLPGVDSVRADALATALAGWRDKTATVDTVVTPPAEANARLSTALRHAIDTIAIVVSNTARDRIDLRVRGAHLPLDALENRIYRRLMQNSARSVSLDIAFAGATARLLVHADGVTPGRFVALAFKGETATPRLCLRIAPG